MFKYCCLFSVLMFVSATINDTDLIFSTVLVNDSDFLQTNLDTNETLFPTYPDLNLTDYDIDIDPNEHPINETDNFFNVTDILTDLGFDFVNESFFVNDFEFVQASRQFDVPQHEIEIPNSTSVPDFEFDFSFQNHSFFLDDLNTTENSQTGEGDFDNDFDYRNSSFFKNELVFNFSYPLLEPTVKPNKTTIIPYNFTLSDDMYEDIDHFNETVELDYYDEEDYKDWKGKKMILFYTDVRLMF